MSASSSSLPEPSPWEVRASHTRFENPAMRVREDTLALPNGEEMQYAVTERGQAVMIVPLTDQGEMVLVRQYRHPVQAWCLEIPAGTARDTHGLSLEEVAAKELKEEVGGTWAGVFHVGAFFSNPALTDEVCHVFVATGVKLSHEPQREASEKLETVQMPLGEVLALVQAGAMRNGPSALSVFLSLPKLRELGFPIP